MDRFRNALENYRAMLDLREHDIDLLHAEHEADLMLVLLLIEHKHLAAAKAIIRRRFAQ